MNQDPFPKYNKINKIYLSPVHLFLVMNITPLPSLESPRPHISLPDTDTYWKVLELCVPHCTDWAVANFIYGREYINGKFQLQIRQPRGSKEVTPVPNISILRHLWEMNKSRYILPKNTPVWSKLPHDFSDMMCAYLGSYHETT